MTQQTPQWANRIVGQGLEDPEQLLANPFNARIHPQFQQESLKAILDEVGWVDRVIVNRISGHVLDGHLRVALAITAGEQVPVEYVELNEREEQLILSTFDWITQQAVYDADHLETLLRAIGDSENDALQALLDDIAAQNNISLDDEPPLEDAGPQIDRGQELAARYGTALGQIWQLGKHRLIIGDSTDKGTIEALMDGKKADAIITDPPYGMALDASYSNSHVNSVKNIKASKGYAAVIGDDEPFDRSSVSISATEEFWFGADYYVDTLPEYGKSGSWLVWDKRTGIEQVEYTSAEFELCWSKIKHQRSVIRVTWFGALGTESQDIKQRVHPTQKPTQVIAQIIERFTDSGDLIVDPFLGSGTTLIAAHQTGRICYGCEISPEYAAVCINRWETLTGEKAALTIPRLDNTHKIPF